MTVVGGMTMADVPRVVTDIAPVQGLVAQVMQGLGNPDMLLTPGSSPHGYAMRPSQARAVQEADLVIWIGPGLTPWLVKPLESLSGDSAQMVLMDSPGTVLLSFDEDHGHDDHGKDEGHEDHAAHDAHDDHDKHDDHETHDDHDTKDAHGHDHAGEYDPHVWLEPANARLWLGQIADMLAVQDPENAPIYRANAAAGQQRIDETVTAITAQLEPVHDMAYVTFHDAYRYFEQRFDLNNAGSVSPSDATGASAARLAALESQIAGQGVVCAFREPQFDPGLLETAGADAGLRIAVLDPLGSQLSGGAAFYPALLQDMADSIAGCLSR